MVDLRAASCWLSISLAWSVACTLSATTAVGAKAEGAPGTAAPAVRPPAPPPLTVAVPGLRAEGRVDIDGFGIPTIHAATFDDALRMQGFLHARDRFAQMDLLRRLTAGELCEIAGALAIAQDRQQRQMRLRSVAEAAYRALPASDQALLVAYAEGVNAGIATLTAPPPEHAFLQAPLAPWKPEDALLIGLGMAAMLNDSARVEIPFARVAEVVPREVIDFLRPRISRWDTLVIPEDAASREAAAAAIPAADVVDTRPLRAASRGAERHAPGEVSTGVAPASDSTIAGVDDRWDEVVHDEHRFRLAPWLPRWQGSGVPPVLSSAAGAESLDPPPPIGSNGWAVAGSRTTDGRAILVNDMHLPLSVPGIWYRMAFRTLGGSEATTDRPAEALRQGGPHAADDGVSRPNAHAEQPCSLDGITLPGVPGLISGSNGRVAWGFTNVEGDFIDCVVVEVDPADPTKYLVPGGSEPFRIERETIHVARGEPETLEVRVTRWGPIVATDRHDRPLALVWAAMQPGGLNVDHLRWRDAKDAADAIEIAAAWRGPQQNVIVADSAGQIGWTISGYLPERHGMDGTVPTSWADGKRGWRGELPRAQRPMVLQPPDGIIVTANQRTAPLDVAERLGRMYAGPERAYRIRERAMHDGPLDEAACARIQLDVQSPRLLAWRDRLLPALDAGATAPAADRPAAERDRAKRCAALAKLLREWDGAATTDSKAVAIVDRARARITATVVRAWIEALIATREPALPPSERATLAGQLASRWPDDESMLVLLDASPDHLLPPSAQSWNGLVQETTLAVAQEIRTKEGLPRWGALNASSIAHPLARAMPVLASSFSIPAHEQPGHWSAVRVASPTFGASERLVVSPGHEPSALLTTPAGQSANPSSPHYADLHPAWRDGERFPLLPGATVTSIRLTPPTSPAPAR